MGEGTPQPASATAAANVDESCPVAMTAPYGRLRGAHLYGLDLAALSAGCKP